MLSRIVNYLLLVIAGLIIGAGGTIAHQSLWTVGRISGPWGLFLSLLAYTALLVGLRLLAKGRLPALAAALGTIAIILVFTQKSAGGSVLILNDLLGQIWLAGPIVIAALVMAWPDLSKHRQQAQREGALGETA